MIHLRGLANPFLDTGGGCGGLGCFFFFFWGWRVCFSFFDAFRKNAFNGVRASSSFTSPQSFRPTLRRRYFFGIPSATDLHEGFFLPFFGDASLKHGLKPWPPPSLKVISRLDWSTRRRRAPTIHRFLFFIPYSPRTPCNVPRRKRPPTFSQPFSRWRPPEDAKHFNQRQFPVFWALRLPQSLKVYCRSETFPTEPLPNPSMRMDASISAYSAFPIFLFLLYLDPLVLKISSFPPSLRRANLFEILKVTLILSA